MKKAILFLVTLFIVGSAAYAQQDIFKKHGFDKEPLTLSNGKYKETFINEDQMQIGTVIIDTRTEKVVKFLEEDTTKYAYRAETTSRFLTIDPHAENYYNWSPYVYVGNNPILRTDPTGKDWYQDTDGSYQFNPELNKKNQAEHLKEGQSYLFASKSFSSNGKLKANYRADGSIMFGKESDAMQRMVTNTKKTGQEEMAALTTEGTLVLPSHLNEGSNIKIEDYKYSAKNGNLVDASGKEYNTVALAHTHPNGSAPSGWKGDGSFMAEKFPNKPNYVLQMKNGQLQGISYIIANSTLPFSWGSGSTGSLSGIPGMTVSNILSGKVSLKSFTKQNLSIMKKQIGK